METSLIDPVRRRYAARLARMAARAAIASDQRRPVVLVESYSGGLNLRRGLLRAPSRYFESSWRKAIVIRSCSAAS